jgi:phosphoadenosine phosphosulfate reductase
VTGQGNLFDQRSLDEKVSTSIERVKTFAPKNGEPIYVAFSGGKDSIILKEIVRISGVPFDCHYNVTTVDPPELVQFIRSKHPDVEFNYPKKSMYQLMISHRAVPTRIARFCCKDLKERGGDGRACVMTGVRWAESPRRAGRSVIARHCIKRDSRIVNPVIDFTDADVWQFIRELKLPYPKLYDDGFTRLGCIGCPMAGPSGMAKEFSRWPGFLRMYYRAIEKFLPEKIERRRAKGKPISDFVSSPKAFFLWWLRDLTKDQRHAKVVSRLIDEHCLHIKKEMAA